jgi:hypothetical protein
MSMSLELKPVESAVEFMAARKLFEKIGFELIGTKDNSPEPLYVARKKRDN